MIKIEHPQNTVNVSVLERTVKVSHPANTIKLHDSGMRGVKGDTGEQGIQGEKGDPGDPATNIVTSVNGRIGAVAGLAEQSSLTSHISNTSNPHSVTKAQVGLANVPNLDTTTAVANTHTHANKSVLDATTASFTTQDETKLDGIETGAEVNVNADWDASSGDSEILNKPFIPSVAGSDTWIQFNDGDAFGADSGLVYDKTTQSLKIAGGTNAGVTLEVGGTIDAYYLSMQGIQFIDNSRNATLNSLNVNGLATIDSSGNITGNNLSGTNTGDQTISSLGLDSDLATFSLPADTTISAFGRTLVDDADAATARTTIGLGSVDNTPDANKPVSTAQATADGLRVLKSGDTMTGRLTNSFNGGKNTIDLTDATGLTGITMGVDTNVYRGGANVLATDDAFSAGNYIAAYNGNASQVTLGRTSVGVAAAGIAFGSSQDTNIYRASANILRTDDAFQVAGTTYSEGSMTIGTGATSATLTLRGTSFDGVTTSIYSDTASAYSFFQRARGTFAAPTAVTNNSFLGSFGFRPHNGTAFSSQDAARFSAVATQDISTTMGGALVFYTAPNGTLINGSTLERMRVDHSGNVRIGSAAAINSRLTFDTHTAASGGILMGTDVNLYRLTTSTLRTDSILSVGSNLTVGGTGTLGQGLRATNIIMSPESGNSSVLPYYENDIAYNRLRGGATRVYHDGVLQTGTDANTDNLYTPSATAFTVAIGSGGVQTIAQIVIEVDLWPGGSYSYGTKVGYAVNEAWRATNVKVEVYTPATSTWTVLANLTGVTEGERFWQHGGSVNPISQLRFTFSGWAGLMFNSFRLGQIYVLNYQSALGSAPFMTRDGGNLFGSLTVLNGANLALGTGTGTKIGTGTTQKLGFWNATPIAQPATGGAAATFAANTSLIANDTATFDGYTIGQVVKALRNAGLLA